jgi:hypothetical protein
MDLEPERVDPPEVSAQPIPAVEHGFLRSLGRNLRAGVRAALFVPTAPADWAASPGQLLALVLAGLAVHLCHGVAIEGPGGSFSLAGVPQALFYVPLILLAGYLIALREAAPPLVLPIALLFSAVSLLYDLVFVALDLASSLGWVSAGVAESDWFGHVGEALFALCMAASGSAILRLTRPAWLRRVGHAATLLVVVALPLWTLPPAPLWRAAEDHGEDPSRDWRALSREEAFYAQPALLAQELRALQAQRPGVEDLYFVGVAGDGAEDVFMKELRVIAPLLGERFDTAGRSLVLVNNPATVRELPIATTTALGRALSRVGAVLDREEDVLFLYLTSHGSEDHRLTMQFWPLELNDLTPAMLKRMLDEAGIKWRVIAISACYSGGFIEALRDDHTLIVTAADAENTSFGCGNEFDFTYFGRAYFDHALRRTWSFTEAFEQARREIGERERSEALTPSNPQIYVGARIEAKLARLSERLSARSRVIQVQAPESGGESGTRACTTCGR